MFGFKLQPINVFRYGAQAVQHSQTMIAPGNNGPTSGTANIDDADSGKAGKGTRYFQLFWIFIPFKKKKLAIC